MKNPLRAELASAIKAVAKLEAEQKTRQGVLDRASALVDKALAWLQKAQEEAATAREGVHARLVAAVTTGAEIAPDNAAREARLAVADAEDAYTHALQTLEAVQWIPDNSLSEAQARVRTHAAAVMGGAIDSLLSEAATLNTSLAEKRLALQAILRTLDRNADYERINSYLSAPLFPEQLAPDAHPVTLAWRRAFDALQRDASMELPR
jgi:hypothetical protein